jgi:uncharacterized damage-inducible protein DinB
VNESILRAHISRALDWADAHVDFDTAVAHMPADLQGAKPDGATHTPWELLEHLRLAQEDILDFCRNSEYGERNWPDEYWPPSPVPPDAGAWGRSSDAFRRDREDLKRLALDPSIELFAAVPHGTGQTYLREFLLVIDHNSYHLGQLVSLRGQLGCWPPK